MKQIKEGKVKKGGINNPPTTPRPAPPKGRGGKERGNVMKTVLELLIELLQRISSGEFKNVPRQLSQVLEIKSGQPADTGWLVEITDEDKYRFEYSKIDGEWDWRHIR